MVREYPVGIWLLRIREGKYKRPLVSRNLNTSGQNPSRFPPPEVPSQNPIITEKTVLQNTPRAPSCQTF